MSVTIVNTHPAMSPDSVPTVLLPVQAVVTAGGGPIVVVKARVATKLCGDRLCVHLTCVCVCVHVYIAKCQLFSPISANVSTVCPPPPLPVSGHMRMCTHTHTPILALTVV